MKPNELYKHLNNTDVAFLVETVVEEKNHLRLTGEWVNIVNRNNLFVVQKDDITINNFDLKNWEHFNVSTRGIFRNNL